ncbi:MAG: response regulator [Opitutus sp.]|nr:response regulator [Opitutus sp.]
MPQYAVLARLGTFGPARAPLTPALSPLFAGTMSTPTPGPKSAAPRILAAEDDATTRRLIEFKLKREGFAIEIQPNGEDLINRAPAFQPQLIILDLMMPIKDGYTTLRALKTDPILSVIPVLMLSGKNQEEDVVSCLKAGAADYMVKPFSPEELVVRVKKLLR